MEIRGNLDIHELIQIRGGNPNNEYILTSTDAEGNSLWRQHWFLTQAEWDEWENTYNESESTQNKQITNLTNIVNELDDNYIVSGEVLVGSQELIFTDKNGGKINVTNAAALFTDTDTYVISGVYDSEKGEVTFTTNIDTTFKVTGFAKELTDSYTTTASLNGNTLSFDNSARGNNFYSVDLSPLLKDLSDRVGDLENVEDTDTFTESATLNNNTLTFKRNNNQTYDVDLSSLTDDELWSKKPSGNNIYRAIGNVGIGTDTPSVRLYVEGDVVANSLSTKGTGDGLATTRILSPGGGSYSNSSSKVTGSIGIDLPQGWTNTMLSFKVKLFDYSTNEHIILNIAGYNYAGSNTASPTWSRTTAWVEGSPKDEHNFKVRFGYDNENDKCVIIIGEETSEWSYPKIYITDLQVGHNNYSPGQWNDDWNIWVSDIWSTLQLPNDGGVKYSINTTQQNTQVNNWIRNNDNSIKYESGNVNVLGGYSLTINDYTFPTNDGSTNQILVTDGNGVVSWGNVSDFGGGGDEAPDKYLNSAILTNDGNGRCPTKILELTMSDNSKINVDVSDISTDNYVSNLTFDNNTNILTLVHSTIDGCGVAPQQTVDLSSLKGGDNVGDTDWSLINNDMYSNPSGNVGIGINTPQTKLHVKDNNAILTLETTATAGGNFIDYTKNSGTKAKVGFISDKVEDFYIWNTETNGAINLINSPGTMALQAKDGQVAIGGIGPLASHSLSVEGTTHLMETNRNDVLTITTNDGILTVGGVNGVGNKTNNVILQHRPQTGGDNSSSSWQTRAANTNDYPEGQIAIELTTYFTSNGENIDYNALAMNSGDNKVNILGATNKDSTAILSLQSDSKITFQSHSISWPSESRETMTIDIANDKVGINQSSPDVDLHINGQIKIVDGTQGNNKVLTSDANGLASWKTPSSGGGSNMPVGSIIQFAGDTAPDGWLMCDGTYHRQDVYRELYQVISNTYDKDSQSGKFSVPDIRGRVPVGKHSTGTFNSLNKKGGVESVTLTKNQVPFLEHSHTMDLDNKFKYPDGTDSVWPESAHWHTIGQFHTAQSSDPHSQVFHDGTVDDHKFVINGHTSKKINFKRKDPATGNILKGSEPGGPQPAFKHHSYDRNWSQYFNRAQQHVPTTGRFETSTQANLVGIPVPDGEHVHTLSDGTDTAVGGGTSATSHTNVQPYIVLNYIIYYGTKNELAPPEEDGGLTSRG